MKTAAEIIHYHLDGHYETQSRPALTEAISEAMKAYASQAIDECARKSDLYVDANSHNRIVSALFETLTDKITEVKSQLK